MPQFLRRFPFNESVAPRIGQNFDFNAAMLAQGVDPSMYGDDSEAMKEDLQARMSADPEGFKRAMIQERSRQQYERRFGTSSPLGRSSQMDGMIARLQAAQRFR